MDEILDGYFEEEDADDFYFKWHVEKTALGKVEHEIEIIDKENNEHIKKKCIINKLTILKFILAY